MSLPTQYDRPASSADVNPKPSDTEQPCDPASASATLTNADLGIISADKVEMTPIQWLWPYRFAAGEIARGVSGSAGMSIGPGPLGPVNRASSSAQREPSRVVAHPETDTETGTIGSGYRPKSTSRRHGAVAVGLSSRTSDSKAGAVT